MDITCSELADTWQLIFLDDAVRSMDVTNGSPVIWRLWRKPFPGIVFAYGVPRLLVTKLRSINLSGIWLDECPCRLCKVESFIFIWGCLEPNLRPGWRHELVSWLFFNARIDSYRDVKKISFRGGKLTSISTLVCLATTFKHHIQKSEPHWSVRGRKDADTFLYLWHFPDTKRLCVAPIQKH